MPEEDFPREDELAGRQGAALYPVGRALRTTFDAENHDSLGSDLTGLMLELAHLDPGAQPLAKPPFPKPVPPVAPATSLPVTAMPESPPIVSPSAVAVAEPSWWRGALGRLLR